MHPLHWPRRGPPTSHRGPQRPPRRALARSHRRGLPGASTRRRPRTGSPQRSAAARTTAAPGEGGGSDLPLSYTALVLLTTVGGCKAATGSGTPPWTWRWLTPPGGHGGALYPLMVPPTSASLVTLPRPPPAGPPRTPPMAAWACRLAVPRGPAGRRRTGAPAPAPP